MTRIYITRHGETLWNVEGRMQGRMDSPLSQKGVYQAKLLNKRLENEEIDIIYSSSLGRTLSTAFLIKGDRDIKLIKNDNLMEINLGDFEGKSQEEIKLDYKEELDNFWNKPHKYKSINGENFNQVQKRIVKEIRSICRNHPNQNVLIVTHAAILKSFLCYVEGKSLKHVWDEPYMIQGSLTILDYDNDKFSIKLYADASHIPDNSNFKAV